MAHDDDRILFADDRPVAEEPTARAWKVLIVDDEREFHDVTRLALFGLRVDGHPVVLMSAYTAEAARVVLRAHADIGMVLLDVVMESTHAGLTLARWIRQELGNTRVRIVLRTGQPGLAPEQRVMHEYDIHDYCQKTELTARRLITTVVGTLRSYRDLCTIEAQKAGLEQLLRATASLYAPQPLDQFVRAVLQQLSALVSPHDSAMFFRASELGLDPGAAPVVVAGTGRFGALVGRPVSEVLDQHVWEDISRMLRTRRPVQRANYHIFGIFRDDELWAAVMLEGLGEIGAWERRLVELFCQNVWIALDNHRLHQRQRAMAAAFARFVPQRLIELLGRPDATAAQLGDQIQREMTVLFVDQRAFTSRAELLDPHGTFDLLNAFFAAIVPEIHAQGGVVDKYLGDGLMAIFPDSPEAAVRAGLAIVVRARALGIGVGIGVHVGPVALGLVGADGRMESTVVADGVNVAARLERLTRRLGADLLVSAAVHQRLPPELAERARPLGPLTIRGKQRLVDVFEVFAADPDEIRAEKQASREAVAAAIAAIEMGDHAGAAAALAALAEAHPRDLALAVLRDECRRAGGD